MSTEEFDLEASRRYWRLAPSGAGKHDTSNLMSAEDSAVVNEWRHGFAKRFSNYVEEDQFLAVMGEEFAGERILSIGSGLGFHEMYYASRGARIKCCDIVPSNLAVIQRVSRVFGLEVETQLLEDNQEFDGPYDSVFIYGSLMTMPQAAQRDLLARVSRALRPKGRIILMLYTWEFARATCGWTNPDEFDPLVFARASDPSVGEEHCPWSDWHDDERLMAVSPPGFHITRRQLWQEDWFVWHELSQTPNSPETISSFFDPSAIEGDHVSSVDLKCFQAAAAEVIATDNALDIHTESTTAGYAAVSDIIPACDANVLSVDFDLAEGAFSAGLLDEAAGAFIASCPERTLGAHTMTIALPPLPEQMRIIFSNFRDTPASSHVTIRRVAFGKRISASLDFLAQH